MDRSQHSLCEFPTTPTMMLDELDQLLTPNPFAYGLDRADLRMAELLTQHNNGDINLLDHPKLGTEPKIRYIDPSELDLSANLPSPDVSPQDSINTPVAPAVVDIPNMAGRQTTHGISSKPIQPDQVEVQKQQALMPPPPPPQKRKFKESSSQASENSSGNCPPGSQSQSHQGQPSKFQKVQMSEVISQQASPSLPDQFPATAPPYLCGMTGFQIPHGQAPCHAYSMPIPYTPGHPGCPNQFEPIFKHCPVLYMMQDGQIYPQQMPFQVPFQMLSPMQAGPMSSSHMKRHMPIQQPLHTQLMNSYASEQALEKSLVQPQAQFSYKHTFPACPSKAQPHIPAESATAGQGQPLQWFNETPEGFIANPKNHGRWSIDNRGNRHYLNAPKEPRGSKKIL